MLKTELIKNNNKLQREVRELKKQLKEVPTQDKKDELIESLQKAREADKLNYIKLENENNSLIEKYRTTLISKNGAIETVEAQRKHGKKMITDFKLNVAGFIAEGWWTRLIMTKEEIEDDLLNDITIYEKFN